MHTHHGRRYERIAYAYAAGVALVMGMLLLGIPVQLSDSFTEFISVQAPTLGEVIGAEFNNGPYFRPFRRGLIKVVYDASGGHYYAAFRGFQVFELFVLLALVVRLLRVRSGDMMAAVPLGVAVVVGIHTFAGAILEGLPVNHFLTILVCCAAAVNVAQARRTWLSDAAAVALLVFAMLTLESGLLIWAVFASAYVAGYRGVSRSALVALTACVAMYFVWRFAIIGGGTPGLDERSAGFGFSVLDPDDVIRRFGDRPALFYAYNFLSAMSCVLFAEPRGGVWAFIRELTNGRPEPWQIVNVVTSTTTTVLLGLFTVRRWPAWQRSWRAGDAAEALMDTDRFVIIFLGVLPFNALFASAYEKDVIMSPAGLLYAIAACGVFHELTAGRLTRVAPALVLVIAAGWSVRFVGIHDSLRARALSVREEWAFYDEWARQQPNGIQLTAEGNAIRQRLYEDAVIRPPRAPQLSLGELGRLLDHSQ